MVNILKVGCVLLFNILIIKKLAVKTLTVTFKLLKNLFSLQRQPVIHKKEYASFLYTILQSLINYKIILVHVRKLKIFFVGFKSNFLPDTVNIGII